MMRGEIILDPATVERVAWTLLHSLWQGAAVCVLMAIALIALARRSANTRYLTLCVGLMTVVAAPAVTFWYLRGAFDDPGPLVLAPATSTDSTTSARIAAAVRPWTTWLLAAWVVGTSVLCVRQLVSWIWLQRLLIRAARPLDDRWAEIAAKLRLPSVRFLESGFLDVPGTAGWLKPVVLLPASALSGLTPQQLEAIVAHELAHVLRRDYLVNLLQTATEVVMFYSPAVWWISRRIREERENCCDDIAASVTGGGRRFADALLALEEHRPSVPLAMAATGGALWRRIARLVGIAPESRRRLAGPAAIVLSLSLVAAGTGHVLASAVSVRPTRQLGDVKLLSDAVYDILGIAPSAESFLPALDAAVAEMNRGGASAESLEALAVALNRSRPDELEAVVLPRVRVDRPLAHQDAPGWTHGSLGQRSDIRAALWERARSVSSAQPTRAMGLARASFLLGAQDSFMFGVAGMQVLLDEPDFPPLAKLTTRQCSRLRRHLSDHRTISGTCLRHLADAERVLNSLGTSGEPNAAQLDDVTQRLSEVLRIGIRREDVQWRVARLAMQMRRAHASAMPAFSVAPVGSSHLARWIGEATEAAGAGGAPRRMTMEQLRKARRGGPGSVTVPGETQTRQSSRAAPPPS